MTACIAKPEKKAGKGNERREIYANQRIKANGRRPLNLRDTEALNGSIFAGAALLL
jgi:hypothetical protein